MTLKIFVSFRQNDNVNYVSQILSKLRSHFGMTNIFTSEMNWNLTGKNVRDNTLQIINDCNIAIILIGGNWLNAIDKDGIKLIQKSNDNIRVEMEEILKNNKLDIFPIILDYTATLTLQSLPKSIEPLTQINAIYLNGRNLERELTDFIDAVEGANKRKEIESSLVKAIAQIDGAYRIDENNSSKRIVIEEVDKHSALRYWLQIFNINMRKDHTSSLLIGSWDEAIDSLVFNLEKELKSYRIQNKIYLRNSILNTYENERHALIRKGSIEGARCMYFHKMRALEQLRFEQMKTAFLSRAILKCLRYFVLWSILSVIHLISDFGQNSVKFILSMLAIIVVYGILLGLFSSFEPDISSYNLIDKIGWGIYISVTALLSFGGISFAPNNMLTQIIVISEYVFGYFSLGLLVAIIIDRIKQ